MGTPTTYYEGYLIGIDKRITLPIALRSIAINHFSLWSIEGKEDIIDNGDYSEMKADTQMKSYQDSLMDMEKEVWFKFPVSI